MKTGGKLSSFGVARSHTRLGRFIRRHRLKRRLTQVELAAKTKISQTHLSRLEKGKGKYIDREEAAALARALRCQPQQLLRLVPEKHPFRPRTSLGRKIVARCRQLGLSLDDVAARMGMSINSAHHFIIYNDRILPRRLLWLAKILELPPQELVPFAGPGFAKPASAFGQLIRNRRLSLGLAAARVADELGVTMRHVCRLELDRNSLAQSDDLLERLARILRLSPALLKSFKAPAQRK